MKKLLVLFTLLASIPVLVFAQAQPPPGPGGTPWPRPDFGAMRQNMQQLQTLHNQFRAKVLGALTPAHRTLLASVAGQLAISTSPDRKAAIQKLDAALTSGEKQAILNAAQSFMTQVRALFEQSSPRPRPGGMERARHAPDAGELLLMIATGGGEGLGMGMHGGFMHDREQGPPGGMRRPWPSPTP